MNIKKKLLIGLLFTVTTLSFSNTIKAVYDNKIPSNIKADIKYKGSDLPKLLDYVFIKTVKGNIRKSPSTGSGIILRAPFNTKFRALEKIQVRKRIWYKVQVGKEIGYISGGVVHFKQFRFEKMLSEIDTLENFINENNKKGLKLATTHSYKPNPYNKGMNRTKDKYGVSLDQNIIGEYNPANLTLHIPDRSIMAILSEGKKYAMVNVEGIKESPLKIEKSHITKRPNISRGFRKVITVDIKNQNLAAFEKINGEWTLVSYIYAKTGLESALGFETPRGSYVVPDVKYEMEYRDNFGRNSGMARYAIRFSGGGYLHGTPLALVENKNKDFFLDEKERGLGTYKGTRKCIRNTEEHARFLFDWVLEGKNRSIKSNYQRPKENVMFIIF